VKSRYNPLPTYTSQWITNKASGIITGGVYSSVGYYELLSVISDQIHGDRKTVNPHEFKKIIFQEYHGDFHRDDPIESLDQIGIISSFTRYVDASPNWSNLYNDALSKMHEQLRSGGFGSGLDLSVDLAEAHQVRKMLKDSLKLVNFIRSFKPRNWANKWLEYQYGWKPLVSSVYGTFDALMHRRLFGLQHVVGQSRDTYSDYNNFSDLAWPGSTEVIRRSGSRRARIGCYFRTKNTTAEQLSGYTSLNPVSIAWELLPYSFVADWFIDIGSYLRNVESALLYSQDFVGGYLVFGYRDSQVGQIYGGKTVGNTTTFGSGSASILQSYKQRSRVDNFPLPSLPSFRADLGWQRLLSGASLLSQHWGK
jgi:hypothetical protein